MGIKVRPVNSDRAPFAFVCPGCKGAHVLPTDVTRDGWKFNGNLEAPTFEPSILSKRSEWPTDEEHARIMAGEKVELKQRICHSYVTDGNIRFLDDCTHELKGQTVPLPDLPIDWTY